MNSYFPRLALLILLAFASLRSFSSDDSSLKMRDMLRQKYPSTRIDAVTPSQFPGFFEVVMGLNIAYVEETGRYFLFGVVFDMATQKDLTAQRVADVQRLDFSSLPLADAVRSVKGTGARQLAVFTDPDCGYCRRLEPDLDALTDVTVYRFLAPLQDQDQGRSKVRAVWCSSDRALAWQRLMSGVTPATKTECDEPSTRNLALMERLGLSGTPSLISTDGRLLLGAQPASQISAWLDQTPPRTPVSLTRRTLKE
jgi:thiol:disulfide interchange protein DsbC